MNNFSSKMDAAIWCAKTLFQKQLVSGSTGNISFVDDDKVYISRSGSCFGRLTSDDFAVLDFQGNILKGKPSKEFPMHLALYHASKENQSIIHTHSFNATLFSCQKNLEEKVEQLFSYTPYLNMQTKGKINIVPFAQPGSCELFQHFKNNVDSHTKVYLLQNHGILVGASELYEAYNIVEEFEMSTHIYSEISKLPTTEINKIK